MLVLSLPYHTWLPSFVRCANTGSRCGRIACVSAGSVNALAGLTACSTKPISKAGSTDQNPQSIVLQMPENQLPIFQR